MRSPVHAALLLLLLPLLLLCCAGGCLAAADDAYRCGFDTLMRGGGPLSTAVVREVPRRGQGAWQAYTASTQAGDWAPIRLKVFTEDLHNPDKFCTRVGDVRSNFIQGFIQCEKADILTTEKRRLFTDHIAPAAVKMHAERLLVKPTSGRVLVPGYMGGVCGAFTVPPSHRTTGVPDADMLLYSAAVPARGPIAWALPCALLNDGRPVVGMFNYDPQHIEVKDINIRVVAHEIAHALGFSFFLMQPKGMITRDSKVRGKSNVTMVISPKTREKARAHYGCPTATGVELEDEGGPGTVGSHWERRNAKDELMAGVSGAGYYTALTMAAFEDMGFYRAKWGMEETMKWGLEAGCDFLTEKCVKNGVSAFPDTFCTEKTPRGQSLCSNDRNALGACRVMHHTRDVPPHFQYFEDPKTGGSEMLMDFCPYIRPFANTGCIDGEYAAMPGSRIGPNSRCVKGDSLQYYNIPLGDICVDVSCEGDAVKIRYLGDDTWYACPKDGYVTPKKTFAGGRIRCPAASDVCDPRLTLQRTARARLTAGEGCRSATHYTHFVVLAIIVSTVVLLAS